MAMLPPTYNEAVVQCHPQKVTRCHTYENTMPSVFDASIDALVLKLAGFFEKNDPSLWAKEVEKRFSEIAPVFYMSTVIRTDSDDRVVYATTTPSSACVLAIHVDFYRINDPATGMVAQFHICAPSPLINKLQYKVARTWGNFKRRDSTRAN